LLDGFAVESRTHHYVTLDAMRGVAAIAVVIFHARSFFGYRMSGALAVDFFFVLSGFVVAFAYDDRLAKGMSFTQFLQKRAIRLYPLYFFGQLLGVGTAAFGIWIGRPSLASWEIAASFALGVLWLPSPFGGATGKFFPLNGPSWSLFWEVIINLAYGLLHKMLNTFVLLGLAAVSGVALLYYAWTTRTLGAGAQWSDVPLGALRTLYSFSIGILLCRHRDLIPNWLGKAGATVPLAALGVILLLPDRLVIDLLFIGIGGPVLVAIGSRVRGDDLTLFRLLGAISFPLYAVHKPLLEALQLFAANIPLPHPVVGGIYVMAMIGLAWLIVPVDKNVRAFITAQANKRGSRITDTKVPVPD
jgi:peptidoglycan/LPS O-acetylase OafA/YrhL